MKVDKHEAGDEKRVLTAMVVDPVVLGRVSDRWHGEGLFRVRWANLVGRWCVDYFQKYEQAPGADIEGLFASWAGQNEGAAAVDLVDRFLQGLSDEYEEIADETNSDYMVDVAAGLFNAVALERMAEAVRGCLDRGDTAAAMDTVAGWDKVEMGAGAGVDVLGDEASIREAFESKAEPLIKYPGALGEFFGEQLGRDEFVAFTGATGRGKTWWLMDVAWQAVRQKRRVAFFEVGDMSQNQIMRRFMCRAAGHPTKPPYELDVPKKIIYDPSVGVAEVGYEAASFGGPLTWEKAWASCEKRLRRRKQPLLRLSVHPNSSINVAGINSVLNVWERGGWVPDVVVIDYADILAKPAGFNGDSRDAINENWKQMRGLSQTRHILLVTATQADANSYTAQTISRSNFSDDRRKNDHVTGMCGINATPEEQAMGVCRLNWTKRREEAYTEGRCVHVAGSLALGRPHIVSTF